MPFQKTQGQPQKKHKAHFEQKTQPFGGSFRFWLKNSRNSTTKLLFFFGVILLKSFLLTKFPFYAEKVWFLVLFCSNLNDFTMKISVSKKTSRIWSKYLKDLAKNSTLWRPRASIKSPKKACAKHKADLLLILLILALMNSTYVSGKAHPYRGPLWYIK